MSVADTGFVVFDPDPRVLRWCLAARAAAPIDLGPWRHGGTWAVGLDALPNAADGSVSGVPLTGPWSDLINTPAQWHRAQLSTVRPGYPGRDPDESEAAHRFRLHRDAAHVDGLLPEGPARRRHLREPHSFILGIPLTPAQVSPLVVWPGSHHLMQAAFRQALTDIAPAAWGDVDLTDTYQTTRRAAFDRCTRTEVPLMPGQAVLLHRHLLHGVAPWTMSPQADRMTAYFRPEGAIADWL